VAVVAAFAAFAVLLGAGCGGGDGSADPAKERLDAADRALAAKPRDPRAMENVIRAAFSGYTGHTDQVSGRATAAARPFLGRATAVWPRYVRATRDRPSGPVAAIMVQVYGAGLNRPADASRAALLLTQAQPTASTYLQLVLWASRSGQRHTAKLAGQKALELADPHERDRIRAAIRLYVAGQG
jgi:hypothetical protein